MDHGLHPLHQGAGGGRVAEAGLHEVEVGPQAPAVGEPQAVPPAPQLGGDGAAEAAPGAGDQDPHDRPASWKAPSRVRKVNSAAASGS